jgi:hypothetical protein
MQLTFFSSVSFYSHTTVAILLSGVHCPPEILADALVRGLLDPDGPFQAHKHPCFTALQTGCLTEITGFLFADDLRTSDTRGLLALSGELRY